MLPALVLAAAIVLTSPWVGAGREWLRALMPGRFSFVINLAVIAAGLVAVGAIALRIGRAPHAFARYVALLSAGAVAIGWTAFNAHMSAETNAVERFHFLEYGAMTWLFYRATRTAGVDDASLLLTPALAGILVGTADEAVQWFVPSRVGEVRDVFLNFAAIGSGLLVSVALAPPPGLRLAFARASRRRISVLSAAAVLGLAAFVHAAHLGHRNVDAEIGEFWSRYTSSELVALSGARREAWRTNPPPLVTPRFAREDQFLFEANRHIQSRNAAWTRDVREAWFENRLLEKYFSAALDTPSYAVPAGSRWPDEQRRDADTRRQAGGAEAPFVSATLRTYVLPWPKSAVWGVALALAVGCVMAGRDPGDRRPPHDLRRQRSST